MNEPVARKRLTPEEIMDEIHQLARDGEGAEKRWALKQLSAGDASITIGKPRTEEEIQERAARILKGIGLESSKKAFAKAHRAATPPQWTQAKRFNAKYLPVTCTQLYEMFPEAEKDEFGYPPGYPHDKGALHKKRWIAEYAEKLNQARLSKTEGTDARDSMDPGSESVDLGE